MARTYTADAAADEADSANEDAAELSDAAIPEASLAALPVSELYRVLKPVVVVATLPAESVTVARIGTVVTGVPEASEAAPEAEARA